MCEFGYPEEVMDESGAWRGNRWNRYALTVEACSICSCEVRIWGNLAKGNRQPVGTDTQVIMLARRFVLCVGGP